MLHKYTNNYTDKWRELVTSKKPTTSVSKRAKSNVHKIHTNKYIERDLSKLITTSMREKGGDKYVDAYIQAVAMKFSRRLERAPSASKTFVGPNVLDYKRAIQSIQQSVRI